jgi:hypothetical protein
LDGNSAVVSSVAIVSRVFAGDFSTAELFPAQKKIHKKNLQIIKISNHHPGW